MKQCPVCHAEFEDRLKFCTYDGTPLAEPGPAASRQTAESNAMRTRVVVDERREPAVRQRNHWKTAFFILLISAIVIDGAMVAFFINREEAPQSQARQAPAAESSQTPLPGTEQPQVQSLAQLPPDQLRSMLPKNLLRRFHEGEPSQGNPDDMRIVKGDGAEYVVLDGAVKSGPSHRAGQRLLVLKYEGQQFIDVTKSALPADFASGSISGDNSSVKFDDTGKTMYLHAEPPATSLLAECSSCDRPYQEITLEWKGKNYTETARAWGNDPVSIFYAVVDALDKRRVDNISRPVIDQALDPALKQGLSRKENQGWKAEKVKDEDQPDSRSYQVSNGSESLIVRVSRVHGQWRAVWMENA